MKIKFEDKEYDKVQDLIAGFVTTEQEGELQFNLVASPELTFNTSMQLLMSMTINLLNAFKESHPDAKEDLYDAYNFMATSVLNTIIPEKELRQDIDEEAILKAQEQVIEEAYAKLSEEEKQAALENIAKIRDRLTDNVNKEV